MKGKGGSRGQDTRDIDGSHYYPLVDPRPEEAPDIDNSTVVQCAGTERSPVHPLNVMDDTLYSQHLKDEKIDDVQDASGRGTRQGEVHEGGGGGRSAKMKGAKRDSDVYKGGGAGLSAKMEDKGAGRKSNVNKDEGEGLGVKKDEGAGRSKVVRRIKGGGRRATRWVKVNLGGEEMNVCCNTGSNITVITPEEHDDDHDATVRQAEEGEVDQDALDPRQDEECDVDQDALNPTMLEHRHITTPPFLPYREDSTNITNTRLLSPTHTYLCIQPITLLKL